MANYFQDDDRENMMRDLFGLYKDENEGRSGVDAYFNYKGSEIPFELKTTSKGSVTTVRDFGPDHIEKWKNKHWLIGFFIDGEEYYKYGTPEMMNPWISSKEDYIKPDFMLADLSSGKLTLDDLYTVIGRKDFYSYDDAKKIQKMQYSKQRYLELQDISNGYSPNRMLSILQNRNHYLIERGSTLNNPHIPFKYFNGWTKISENHAEVLARMVHEYFEKN